jgi:cobyrinic acid a,c-diamide synthase
MIGRPQGACGLIIGAPRSGSGKTSVTLGLIVALVRRGLKVRGMKSGPDYIDPGFHAAATNAPGFNLDSWAMPPALLRRLAAEAAAASDLVVIESAMGFFDGIPGEAGRSGSAADLARLFRLPLLLVLDVSGQSQTAAAVAKGFALYDPAIPVAGVILNRVGSDRHRRLAGEAIAAIGLPVVGAIRRDPSLVLPERHLGLVQASEHGALDTHLARLGDMAEQSLDLGAIVALAEPLRPTLDGHAGDRAVPLPLPGQRIARALDAAFSFVYPHVLDGWRRAGAEIRPFSPLADEAPPSGCDACWLPGGYPELHAGRLSAAANFALGMRAFAEHNPVHGECGGFMVLGRGLTDGDGHRHEMLGLLDHETSFAKRRMNLGYREARLRGACPLGAPGAIIRGHEFHYASVTATGTDEPLADLSDGRGESLGPSGARRGQVSGAFFHAIAGASASRE